MFEPSWRDGIVVIVSLPLGAVAALDEELARSAAMEVGSECNIVWSA
jgi:hypothetical protein